jgi:hypothetical protein
MELSSTNETASNSPARKEHFFSCATLYLPAGAKKEPLEL